MRSSWVSHVLSSAGMLLLFCVASVGADDISCTVVIDQSYGQVCSPYDASFAGMSEFALMLKAHGAAVYVNREPLDCFVEKTAPEGTVLILGPGLFKVYAQSDLDALQTFVKQGGGLLVVAEHDNIYCSTDQQNDLLRHFGIEVQDGKAFSASEDRWEKIWVRAGASRFGVGDIRMYMVPPIVYTAPVQVLVTLNEPADPARSVAGVTVESGKGRLLCLADYEQVWNMDGQVGFYEGDNAVFMLRCVEYLAGHALASVPRENRVMRADNGDEAPSLLLDLRGSVAGMDTSPGGLSEFAAYVQKEGINVIVRQSGEGWEGDVVMLPGPVRDTGFAETWPDSMRLIAVAEGVNDVLSLPGLLSALADAVEEEKLMLDSVHPVNALLKERGVRFLDGALMCSDERCFDVPCVWDSGGVFSLHYATALSLPAESELKVIARTRPEVWLRESQNPLLAKGIRPVNEVLYPVPRGISAAEGLPVAAYDGQFFLLSDLTPLLNSGMASEDGREVARRIVAWIRRGEARE